jgi:hypothetical protein
MLRARLASACVLAASLLLAPRVALAAGAVETVAQQAAAGAGTAPPSSVVIAAPLAADQPVGKADELALRIAALVAGKIGASARVHPQTATLATARGLAGRSSALLYVQTEVARGDLRTTVDVYPSMANAWDRIRNPLPAPIGHSFASAKIDAEVRAFLSPLVLELASVHRAKHAEGGVLAVGCGDVDGDGGNEIVLVSRDRITMGRVRGASFEAERSVPWSPLAPRVPVPMREPLGGAAITLGAVDAGTTDRGGFALTPELGTATALSGIPCPSDGGVVCVTAQPSAGAFDGAPIDCASARDPKAKMAVPSPRFDAFAAANVADASGTGRQVVATREPSGRLKVRVGDAVISMEGTFGAQLAVGDLDQDGIPDLATTTDGPDDALNVFSVSATGEVRGRLHLAAPAGVRAMTMCPSEARGQPVLVAIVGDELWLVRAGEPVVAAADGRSPALPEPGRNLDGRSPALPEPGRNLVRRRP